MKHSLKQTLLGCGAIASLLLSASLVSCQDEDFGYTTQDVRDAVYARNFEKMYGKIAEDQIWDFSSYNLKKLGLVGGPSNNLSTRATSADVDRAQYWQDAVTVGNAYYSVDPATITWLNTNMKEKDPNNANNVTSFSLNTIPGQDFYIIPIFQGQSGMVWDLELEDLNGRHRIWTKSENFIYTLDYSQYEEFYYDVNSSKDFSYHKISDDQSNQVLNFERAFTYYNKTSTPKDAKIKFSLPSNSDNLKGHFIVYHDADKKEFTKPTRYWFDGTAVESFCDGNGVFTFNAGQEYEIDLSMIVNADHNIYETDGKTSHSVGDKFQYLAFEVTGGSLQNYTTDDKRIKIFAKYSTTKDNVSVDGTATNGYCYGHTMNRRNVQTKLLKIDGSKISGSFKFNLYTTDVTNGDKVGNFGDYADNHYSDEGYMAAITHFSGDGAINKKTLAEVLNSIYSLDLPEDGTLEYMVLSCEDAAGTKSDKDYNDVVFLVVGGPKLPRISDGTIEKRYMIEDLGSTFDFDFNDIVVDVTEEHVRNLANQSEMKIIQTATIRHLCGTIPFRVYLGEQTFGDYPMYGHNNGGQPDGFNPEDDEYTKKIYESNWISVNSDLPSIRSNRKIWDPDNNNIKVYVWPTKHYDESSVGVYWNAGTQSGSAINDENNGHKHIYDQEEGQLVLFPHDGELPYIIATNRNVDWMKENISIPTKWIETVPQSYYEYNEGNNNILPTVTLWTGQITDNNWTNANVVDLNLQSVTNAYTYSNTLLRVWVDNAGDNNKNIALQISSNSDFAPDADRYNNVYRDNAGPLDINMDETFFNNIKNTKEVTIKGNNLKVTKIEFVQK